MGYKPTTIHSDFVESGPKAGASGSKDAADAEKKGMFGLKMTKSQSRHAKQPSVPSAPASTTDETSAEGSEKADSNVILVVWDGEDDPENPLNWPLRKKYLTTGMLCAMCLFIGLGVSCPPFFFWSTPPSGGC